jgi:hypothetical protein
MQITNATLGGVDGRYGHILELTPQANQLLARLELAKQLRNEYATAGFVKVDSVLPSDALTAVVTNLLPILSSIAEDVIMLHTPSPEHTLSDGFRFLRVDPYCISHPAVREKMTQVLSKLGLLEFGSLLASKLTPLIRYIVGPVSFRRIYFYVYTEGDYISVHDDHHIGKRVDVQFPITLGTVAGLRVLSDGYLRMHYDSAGSMNVLGPCIWHDVPPILRGASGVDPHRFNMGFRFTPDE